MTAATATRVGVEPAPVSGHRPPPLGGEHVAAREAPATQSPHVDPHAPVVGRDLAHVPARDLAPALAARVLRGLPAAGRPLDASARSAMERRLGHDLGGVRVHADAHAAATVDRFRARALTVGTNILFAAGQLRPSTPEGERLLAHELVHTAQQRAAGRVSVQLDAIADVEKLLSYGLLDWAITDAEAMEALAILEAIPDADLPKELARLSQKAVDRLLDNVPDAAKTGPGYTRIVQALGTARTIPYATEQLSYGLFDLAITDAEVTRVFNTFTNLPEAEREGFLAQLNAAGRLSRLVSNANSGHHRLYLQPWIKTLPRGRVTEQQRQLLRVIVSESDDVTTLDLAAEVRFDVTVGPTTIPDRPPVPWEAKYLRETYLTLDLLPEAHVARNAWLLKLGQFKLPAPPGEQVVAGSYQSRVRELGINVEPSDDLRGTIRHETGHAVDAQLGWKSGPEPAKPERGGWKSYQVDWQLCATDMIQDAAAGLSQLTGPQQGFVAKELAKAMGNLTATGLKDAVKGLAWFPTLAADKREAALADPSFTAIEVGLSKPWKTRADGGEHLGPHVYQNSYRLEWVRYQHQARARMVSSYQFRSPGEWFAEAYDHYYAPDSRGKGKKLEDKDPDTKKYFDDVVDKLAASR
jgi:hypothetical protein